MKTKTIKSPVTFLIMLVISYIMIACTAVSASAATLSVPTDDEQTSVVVLATSNKSSSSDDSSSGWTNINTWIEGITDNLKIIGYAIAGICVVALGIIFITGGGQALQKGKGMAIGILVGVATISFGVSLISSLKS
jgi:hypothetical protein